MSTVSLITCFRCGTTASAAEDWWPFQTGPQSVCDECSYSMDQCRDCKGYTYEGDLSPRDYCSDCDWGNEY